MEIQLQELIEQIKADGVAVAEKEAAAKVAAAETQAQQIVADAKAEAARIMRQAREENDRVVKASEDAIRQAGRNSLIAFRESVARELDAILAVQIDKAYSPEELTKLIPTVVQNWAGNTEAEALSVLLDPKDLAAMEAGLMAELKNRMLQGITLKADERVGGGFRIASSAGGAYYDFSAEAVAEMFSAHLNPRVAALLKEAAKV